MDTNKTILVVDDEKNIVDIIKAYLEKEDYYVLTAMNGKEALEVFRKNEVHLIILDLMMPVISGEELCNMIRAKSDIPIIMLTAKVEEENIIRGIKNGADDYIKKPFSVRELMVRVEALLRRTYKDRELASKKTDIYNQDNLNINFQAMTVKKEGNSIELTPNEFKILKVMIINAGIVLTREQIIGKAFGINFDGFDRTIDTHIKNIRQKIEDDPRKPHYIKTIYGIGYKFCITDNRRYLV